MNNFLDSIIKRDPAAKSKLAVIIAYPGIKAIFFHYIAHKIWKLNFFLIIGIKLSGKLVPIKATPEYKCDTAHALAQSSTRIAFSLDLYVFFN